MKAALDLRDALLLIPKEALGAFSIRASIAAALLQTGQSGIGLRGRCLELFTLGA